MITWAPGVSTRTVYLLPSWMILLPFSWDILSTTWPDIRTFSFSFGCQTVRVTVYTKVHATWFQRIWIQDSYLLFSSCLTLTKLFTFLRVVFFEQIVLRIKRNNNYEGFIQILVIIGTLYTLVGKQRRKKKKLLFPLPATNQAESVYQNSWEV